MIGEASQIKGQEYKILSKVVDNKGNKINTQADDNNTAGTTSIGKGGVLDSVAQNHIEDLDVEKEKALLESKDIITEYGMYISGQIAKAANEYSDSSKSQLEKRVLDDIKTLTEMDINEQKIGDLITDEYYGGNNIFKLAYKNGHYDNPTQEELEDACKIIKTILRLRMNYVNKITSLMQKMLRINYRVLGLSEEQAKIYIDSLKSNDNSSVKTVGDIKNIIFANKDKFITNGGKSVDLRKLGFGVILCGDEELNFVGSKSNEEAMFKLIQQAMRYDVVVVAHGGESSKYVGILSDEDEKSFNNDFKDYIHELYNNTEDKILDQIESKFPNYRKALAFISNFNSYIDSVFNFNYYIRSFDNEIKKINSITKDNLLEACKKATKEYISNASSVAHSIKNDYISMLALQSKKLDDEQSEKKYKLKLEIAQNENVMTLIVERYFYGKLEDCDCRDFIKKSLKHYWSCQPTRTLKAGPFEDVNELVRQLIKEGYKKILIEDCNPGGHKLADDIMNTKGILINHSNFSNYVESSLINTNDQNYLSIYEAENQLKIFAESYGIDYDDDQYLNECCSWYKNNYEVIQEGKVIDILKAFFKKVIGAIIGFVKGIIGLIKKAFHKLKEKFNGTKEEPKYTESKFQKPIDASFIDIKSNKVVKVSANNRKDLEKIASNMCSAISDEIKKINSKQQSSMKKIEKDIDTLEKQENNRSINNESFIDNISEFISMDQDLLEAVNFFNEFQEDENGNPADTDNETDDSDYTVDDEDDTDDAQQNDQNSEDNNTEPETQDNNEPEDDNGTDDYSMDDDTDTQSNDQPDTQSENEPETQSDDAQQNDQNQEDDNADDDDYEIPDDGSPEPDGDDEFSMDDDSTGGDTADGNTDDPGYQSSDDMSSDSGDNNTSEKLKDLESVVFADLSPEEKKMKIKELKDLYITVYNKCGSILELITGIRKDEETVQIIEYISNTLIDLKQYVNDYMNDVFDSKTYMENLSQLQKYIMIFTAINKVFAQIRSENE